MSDKETGRHSTGHRKQHQQRGAATTDGGGLPDARIASYAGLATMTLDADVVLLEHGEEEAELLTIRELVRRDLADPATAYCVTWTEPFLSVEHILGIGDDWTDAERDKHARLVAARQEAQSLLREIGAPSVEDALRSYFDDELVLRYLSDDPAETLRVRGWLGYVHRANGSLTNPGGFLRSRLDSCRWPPRGTRRDGLTR